jgi:hypothetical protein
MWLDGFQWEKAEVRISEWRVREAISAVGRENGSETEESRARILAIACPYEPPRFDDATKTVPGAEGLMVKDITELLAESMGIEG